MDKRSASTIGLAADTLLAAATQIWNCWLMADPQTQVPAPAPERLAGPGAAAPIAPAQWWLAFGAGARRVAAWLLFLVPRVLGALALLSALIVGALRWVDPPVSSFMVRQVLAAWRADRQAPAYYHTWVSWRQIPPVLPLAVIAGEDQRFADHHGFDPVEIRASLALWRQGRGLRGASTITQQTAKNLFLWPGRSWVRKGLEAWFTALIEVLWSKQRILEVYLNIVQFSPSTYGVGAASTRYFKRPVEAITLNEAALLAAVLPAPSAYRLERPSVRLLRRAAWIADQVPRLGGRRYLGRL